MALKIRLARGGSKKRPYYHVVLADARSPRDGRFLENLGSWNPMLAKDDEKRVQLNAERIKHWIEHGAQPTDRVLRFLDEAGVAKREVKNNPVKAKPGKRAQERAAERLRRSPTLRLLLPTPRNNRDIPFERAAWRHAARFRFQSPTLRL